MNAQAFLTILTHFAIWNMVFYFYTLKHQDQSKEDKIAMWLFNLGICSIYIGSFIVPKLL